jgi:hypothetical protein
MTSKTYNIYINQYEIYHWFLKRNKVNNYFFDVAEDDLPEIIDLTKEQFNFKVDYHNAKRSDLFLIMSNRTKKILDLINLC